MQRSWKERMTEITGLFRKVTGGLLLMSFLVSSSAVTHVLADDQPTDDQPTMASKANEASKAPEVPEPAEASKTTEASEPLPEPIAIEPTPAEKPAEANSSAPRSESTDPIKKAPAAPEPVETSIQLAPPIKISPPEKISVEPEASKKASQATEDEAQKLADKKTESVKAAERNRDEAEILPDPTANLAIPRSPKVPAPATPPVMLAPDLLPDQAKQAKSMATIEVKSASFQGLTPGESTRDQVVKSLGEPAEATQQGDESILLFQVGPFPEVKISIRDDLVHSIIIQLAAPTSRQEVAQELDLGRFRPIPIHDDSGKLLGEVFPERGMMFAYDLDQPNDDVRIGQVAIESISGEAFLLRAVSESTDEYAHCLADIGIAQQLLPDNAQVFWIQAIVLGRCGRLDAACQAADRALALQPDHVDYQLTRIDLLRQKGKYEEALIATQEILASENISPLGRAEAQLQWGRLLAVMPPRDHKAAMDKTVRAVKMAVMLTNNTPPDVSRKARQLAVESQLDLAKILAHGPWKKKYEVSPQWLLSAEQSAKDLISKDDGDRALLLRVYCTSLECLAVLDGKGSPDQMADAAIQLGRTLIGEAVDEDYRARLEWELGVGLWHAARIELNHRRPDRALQFADNADALLTNAGQVRASDPQTDYHLGQLHYLIGSIYALHKNDAAAATDWYDKALARMKRPAVGQLRDQQGALGEQLVSIGISFWDVGKKSKALSITEEGTELIQEAVERGARDKQALAIPFENLVAMHQALGNSDQAKRVANRATRIGVGSASQDSQRR